MKIYFHVVRRSDGSGGQSLASVNQALQILQTDFNPIGISFDWDSSINYIDNTTFYNTPSRTIFQVDNHTDGIDIYLFDDDTADSGGLANGVGESSEFYVSGSYENPTNTPMVTSSVISHEMGHVLFLWHTHHGTRYEGGDPNQCKELVDGSNSNSCGDYVIDTPADPYLGFNVNLSNCVWNGSGTDANGDSYNPDTTQIMSYSHPDCMSHFSQGQGVRARNAIATLPFLQQTVVDCGTNCQDNITITQHVYSGNTDNQSAENSIIAMNTIYTGATANYDAGNTIYLKPGFHAKSGSTFRAFIEGCSQTEQKEVGLDAEIVSEEVKTNTIEEENDTSIKIYPNPTNGIFKVSSKEKIISYTVLNQFNKVISNKKVSTNSIDVDIQNLSKGVYFIRIQLDSGKMITKKIMKE
ncbi:MAG: zinc-dependent metalloprotease [Polaribacter sp.]